jgi:hypothetical protein
MTVDSPPAPAAIDARPVAAAGTPAAAPRRHPVAHWVTMCDDDGRARLTCVWETPVR